MLQGSEMAGYTMRDYENYFRKAHEIIYKKPASDIYSHLWAKICWQRQEDGKEVNLPTLQALKEMDNMTEQLKSLNRGVFGEIRK